MDEYMKRAPEDKSQWKIVPVAPRPFPAEMRDPQAPADPLRASAYALAAYAGLVLLGAGWFWRRRHGRAGGTGRGA
jgi:hypothetical protein